MIISWVFIKVNNKINNKINSKFNHSVRNNVKDVVNGSIYNRLTFYFYYKDILG